MIDELKKSLKNAKAENEKKEVTEELKHTMRSLSDEELEGVAGGVAMPAVHQYA